MTIEVGKPTGGLIMPQRTSLLADIEIRTSPTAFSNLSLAAAYTAIELDFTPFGFDTATLQQTSDTTEQTVIDVSGQSGVLTNVVSPSLVSGGGTVTVRVTVDGSLKTFIATLVTSNSSVMYLGGTAGWGGSTAAVNYGANQDFGYSLNPQFIMLNPAQAIEQGVIGIPFKNSLKVTVQGSTNLRAGGATNKSVVAFLTSLPEGL